MNDNKTLSNYNKTDILYVTMQKLRPDGRVVDVLAYNRGKLGSNRKTVNLTQVAVDSPLMQSCAVCVGASYGNGLRQFATS